MSKENNWKEELAIIKEILDNTEMQVAKKWGTDVYTINGKNVIAYGGFKHFVAIWFYNGIFLKDHLKVLVNASPDKTKALRQWRFTNINEINTEEVEQYVQEAINNQKIGISWKPEKSKYISYPEILKEAFRNSKGLQAAFQALSFYKQKEYIEYISSAKTEKTNLNRMQKVTPMIIAGQGLYDKYK